MPKVILVNPSRSTVGFSFMTPRWLFVMAQATPADKAGEPVVVDEAIQAFDPALVEPGDLVGIGIATVNCRPGYRVLQQAKARGATVVVGGVHATLLPQEPLEFGADAVVTGNGDLIWPTVVADAFAGQLQKRYVGGRVAGDALMKANWSRMDPGRYMFPTVQTVAGCPENCSFCSVWVSDGRKPRQRLTENVIEEVNELYDLGYRVILLADDNFAPATLGRIAREPNLQKRKELEKIREARLRFFDEYDKRVPKNIYAFSQITSEIVSDDEYLSALFHKMRIRQALVGVESFSEAGLKSANKTWNPAGRQMGDAISKIQEQGIVVLASCICGLESDTVDSLKLMREMAMSSGALMAQFALYNPYPGTKDYFEMIQDRDNQNRSDYKPKHTTRIVVDRFWLTDVSAASITEHAHLTRDELLRENRLSWDTFYAMRHILKRTRRGIPTKWPLMGKITYIVLSIVFRRVYAGNGLVADMVQRRRLGLFTKLAIKVGAGCYTLFCGGRMQVRVWAPSRAAVRHS
jgi:radical SAM superfamily enzyme YgiQ (UPF0313 family)